MRPEVSSPSCHPTVCKKERKEKKNQKEKSKIKLFYE
jgi:hypothetical protein